MSGRKKTQNASQELLAVFSDTPAATPAPAEAAPKEATPGPIDASKIKDQIMSDLPATPRRNTPHYRFNLKLSAELNAYLEAEAYRLGMSRTELVNRILLAYAKENPHR